MSKRFDQGEEREDRMREEWKAAGGSGKLPNEPHDSKQPMGGRGRRMNGCNSRAAVSALTVLEL